MAEKPTGETVSLPLRPIVGRFTGALVQSVLSGGDGVVSLPLDTVLPQLAGGSVKVRFGEIRAGATEGVFSHDAKNDDTLVEIPLSEIVPLLHPSQLPRRTPVKKLDAPPEVTNLFGPRGQALQPPPAAGDRVAPKPAASAPKAPAPPAARPPATPNSPAPAVQARPSAPSPRSPTSSAQSAAVPAPPASKIAASNIPLPNPGIPKAPSPAPASSAPIPAGAQSSLPRSSTSSTPGTTIAPRAGASSSPESSSLPVNFIPVLVSAVSDAWPNPIKLEIAQDSLNESSISIPVDKLEQALRVGKIVFNWRQIRDWLNPSPPPTESPNSEMLVELPLQVVAPIFIANHRPGKSQRKLVVSDSIPNLFYGGPATPPDLQKEAAPSAIPPVPPVTPKAPPFSSSPRPEMPAPPLPKPPAPPKASAIPASTLPVPPRPAPSPAPAPENQGSAAALLGHPEKSDWSPAEIIEGINKLKGVSGSVLASDDGLLIAGQISGEITPETVAAFTPQIFNRVNQSVEEFQLGGVSSVLLHFDHSTCQVYKTGNLFLAVLSRGMETLPQSELRTIASQLGKQTT